MDWKKLLGSVTESVDEELRLRNAYLVTENRILRQQINGRVPLTGSDRKALAEIGHKLGRKTLAEIATVATPDTILAWHRQFAAQQVDTSTAPKSVGRPRIDKEVEECVLRMARENRSWGYDRIVGALANLGYALSDQTVGNILKRHGIPPAPQRQTTVPWREFIRIHMDLLLTTDFFTEVGTLYRLVIYSLLFFMPCDRLTLSVVSMTLLLKKRWMLLISLWSTDGYVSLERWVCLIKETVLSGLLLFGDTVVRPLLGECEAHDPHALSPQSMGKVVYLSVVNRPQIRDGPRQRQQRLSGRWADADREAA
ncbi:MAG TPA: helix-turn-helix domain-containing protein [Candidatus Tectomicrobia bacterium]